MRNRYIFIFMALGLLSLGLFAAKGEKAAEPAFLGSIGAVPYKATTTDATWNQASRFKVLKTGSGYLGSVVITGGTLAASLNFYDGTTTASHANHATTSIGAIRASTPAGTYTFDVAFARGLVVEFPDAIGAASSTITWQ